MLRLHPEWTNNRLAVTLGMSGHIIEAIRQEPEATLQIAKLGSASWPKVWDEAQAVARRRAFQGMDYFDLLQAGVPLSLDGADKLSRLVEQQRLRSMSPPGQHTPQEALAQPAIQAAQSRK